MYLFDNLVRSNVEMYQWGNVSIWKLVNLII